ncbi:MAG TPA: MFS transporter [Steroidobacteraceae bacterium]|nr:MFS transporter [Steroidobacteraceae bacterium]
MNLPAFHRQAAPDGLLASLLLAFLATAGLYYVNIMPALIEGLKTGLHFSDRTAGLAGSFNVYGAVCGALIATVLVTRLPWRRSACLLLLLLIAMDTLSIFMRTPAQMLAARALHGVFGGLLVGFAFSVIARTARPVRTFGMLLVVQDGLGGLGVMVLPQLVPAHGTKVLFFALIAFSLVTMLMLPFLAPYPRQGGAREAAADADTATVKALGPVHAAWGPLVLAMAAIFLFQFSNMLLFSYILGLALHYRLEMAGSAAIVGVSTWVGIIGSLLVMGVGTRFGRVRTVLIALLLTAIGMWILRYSGVPLVYAIANCGTAITWSFVIPYLLGTCAKLDSSGRAAAFGGFASKLGLATGPLAGALLLGNDRYERLVTIATLGIVACALVALPPAALLDRSEARAGKDSGAAS